MAQGFEPASSAEWNERDIARAHINAPGVKVQPTI
jgi:hypothetical protein